jgi:hypothetical protein
MQPLIQALEVNVAGLSIGGKRGTVADADKVYVHRRIVQPLEEGLVGRFA